MTKRYRSISLLLLAVAGLFFTSCNEATEEIAIDTSKIVSLDGSISEVLVDFGLESNLVGVDVTSTYPESLSKVQKIGHNRNINAEGIIALQPTVIIGPENSVKPEILEQFKAAGIKTLFFKKELTVEGTKGMIQAIGDSLHKQDAAKELVAKIDKDIQAVPAYETKPRVLFIYARGVGTLNVAGNNTSIKTMIELAGGENAAKGFDDYKPFTPEAVVEENPDVILLFTSGLESLDGPEGLLKIPGIAATNAGKNKKVVTMDGQYVAGMGPRLGLAAQDLAKLIHQ